MTFPSSLCVDFAQCTNPCIDNRIDDKMCQPASGNHQQSHVCVFIHAFEEGQVKRVMVMKTLKSDTIWHRMWNTTLFGEICEDVTIMQMIFKLISTFNVKNIQKIAKLN